MNTHRWTTCGVHRSRKDWYLCKTKKRLVPGRCNQNKQNILCPAWWRTCPLAKKRCCCQSHRNCSWLLGEDEVHHVNGRKQEMTEKYGAKLEPRQALSILRVTYALEETDRYRQRRLERWTLLCGDFGANHLAGHCPTSLGAIGNWTQVKWND